MDHKYTFLFFLWMMVSCTTPLNAQYDIFISNITNQQGIKDVRVNSIAQDSFGVIWFGLFGEGLATYNGNRIRRVRLENEARYANRRTMFCADSKHLYLNSTLGLEVFDPIHEKIIDTIGFEHSIDPIGGFDRIKIKISGNDTLFWGLKNEGKIAEINPRSIKKISAYTIYLSINKEPFKQIGPKDIHCKGVPILIPYEDNVLLKTMDNFCSMNLMGSLSQHKIPDISIGELYDGNVVIDNKNTLWIGSQIKSGRRPSGEVTLKNHHEYEVKGHVKSFDLKEKRYTAYSYAIATPHLLSDDNSRYIHQLLLLKDKLVQDLQLEFALDTKKVEALRKIEKESPFLHALPSIESYLVDRSGVIWLVGDFGLVKVWKPDMGFRLLPHISARSFVEDNQGVIYGNVEGRLFKHKRSDFAKISVYDQNTGKVTYKQIVKSGDKRNNLSRIHWLKTDQFNGEFYAANLIIDPKTGIAKAYPNAEQNEINGIEVNVLIDRKKRVWRATWGSEKIIVLDPKTNKLVRVDTLPDFVDFPVDINDIYERSSTGNIWVGTNGKGIYVLPSEQGKIAHYNRTEASPVQLIDNVVSGFYEDHEGQVWIGHGLGLSKISKDLSSIKHYPIASLLNKRRLIYSILPDDDSNFLWLSSDQGIYRYDIKNNAYMDFPMSPSIMNVEYNRTSYLKSSRGTLLYGGLTKDDRTVVFDPKEVIGKYEEATKFKAPIILNKLTLNRAESKNDIVVESGLNALQEIVLHPGDRYFELEFGLADYRSTQENVFSYQLVGYDQQKRHHANHHNKVRYENLNPGSYTLVLHAGFNAQAAMQNTREIQILVLPFWYETALAKIIGLLLLACLIYLIYRFALNKRLQKQEAKRLKELNELKANLYTNITHEFRTPLTVILGMNDNISGHDQEKSLIRRNAKNLLQLITQLLNLSKLDAGKLKVNAQEGDLVGFIHYLTEAFYSMASERKIELSFSSNVDMINISFDENKIQHILFNLISNAIKFTRPGGKVAVEIEIPLKPETAMFSIIVKDTGIGIDTNHLPHIFERFYQVEEGQFKTIEGSGIGLAFVKELVDLMGGQIEVKSKVKWGTEFKVLLPFQSNIDRSKDSFTPISSKNSTVVEYDSLPLSLDQIPSDKPIILIIEDNVGVITYLKSILTEEYHVEIAMNGAEGIEQAKDIVPDIILSDVMMPEKNGFEVVRELKHNVNTSHIPIVMLTAKSDLSSKILGFEYGADAYLSKPFEKDELQIRIKNLLAQRKKLQAYYRGNIPLPPIEISVSNSDQKFLEDLKEKIKDKVYSDDFSVTELPKITYMSNTQFYRKLKALTGQTPTVFIRTIRLQKGIQLLRETDLSIAEIAYKVGFSDPNYFTRIFKKQIGKVPGDFR